MIREIRIKKRRNSRPGNNQSISNTSYRNEQRISIPSTAASRQLPLLWPTLVVIVIILIFVAVANRAGFFLIIILATSITLETGLELCPLLLAADIGGTIVLPKSVGYSLIRILEPLIHTNLEGLKCCLGLFAPLGPLLLHQVIIYLKRITVLGQLELLGATRKEAHVNGRLEMTLSSTRAKRKFVVPFVIVMRAFINMHIESKKLGVNARERLHDE